MNQDVPRSLRIWFIIHFAADMLFAMPLMALPQLTLEFFGFSVIEPLTALSSCQPVESPIGNGYRLPWQ
jgi:hypothetical protein